MDCRNNPTIKDRTKVLHALCEVAQTYLRAAEYFCTLYPQTKGVEGYAHHIYEKHAKKILKQIRETDTHFEGISETR